MCGRFVMVSPSYVISEVFCLKEEPQDLLPSYNITPGQSVYAVLRDERNETNRLARFRWGLVPSWAKDPSVGNRMINARAESVAERPSFKEAFRDRRCLVVADGFYEWQKTGRKKIPFFIRLKSRQPFGMAGLYEVWVSPAGKTLRTCTIITTRANDLLSPIHDRMPVIVPREKQAFWLDRSVHDKKDLLDILKPFTPEEMEVYRVSMAVNSPLNDKPELILPVPDS